MEYSINHYRLLSHGLPCLSYVSISISSLSPLFDLHLRECLWKFLQLVSFQHLLQLTTRCFYAGYFFLMKAFCTSGMFDFSSCRIMCASMLFDLISLPQQGHITCLLQFFDRHGYFCLVFIIGLNVLSIGAFLFLYFVGILIKINIYTFCLHIIAFCSILVF